MKRSNLDLVQAQRTLKTLLMATIFVGAMFAPVFANGAVDFGGTDKKVCGFFNNINGLLNIASIAVVTIAVIFAGYQIAFAHKRIADVAPILIGGVLIGAAGQMRACCWVTAATAVRWRQQHYLINNAIQYYSA